MAEIDFRGYRLEEVNGISDYRSVYVHKSFSVDGLYWPSMKRCGSAEQVCHFG